MKKTYLLRTLFVLSAFSLNQQVGYAKDFLSDNPTKADGPTYELVWSDEFNVDGPLNEKDWCYEIGFVRNREPQWYQSENVTCKDGNLVITAKKERKLNDKYNPESKSWKENIKYAEYTSGSVKTKDKHDLLYGRMEVRAKIPTTSGAWPAIWCLGYKVNNGQWPACGEIDILEFYTKQILANVAWSNEKGEDIWHGKKYPFTRFLEEDPLWSDKYHVWRMDWDENSIRLYLDDVLLNTTYQAKTVQPVGERCKVAYPFKTPLFILLNLALRSSDAIDESAFPLHYYIDYVRFYKLKE